MNEDRVILSERPEDVRKAVEWGHEQQRKILNEKDEQIAEALMEKNDTFNFAAKYHKTIENFMGTFWVQTEMKI